MGTLLVLVAALVIGYLVYHMWTNYTAEERSIYIEKSSLIVLITAVVVAFLFSGLRSTILVATILLAGMTALAYAKHHRLSLMNPGAFFSFLLDDTKRTSGRVCDRVGEYVRTHVSR